MHPILAVPTRVLLYLLAWLPIAGLLAVLMHFSGGLSPALAAATIFPLVLVFAFVCLSPWYLCRLLPIGPGTITRVLRSQLSAAVVASFFWIICAKGYGLLLSRWEKPVNKLMSGALPILFLIGLLLYILAVSLHYVLLTVQASRDAETEAHRAQALAKEAELKALKSQINPHFLFNSLNSISALTMADPKRAREMCIRLSEFLRSTLSLGDREVIAFAEELALTRTYLGVEKVRFGARLRFEEQIDLPCNSCQLPPLLMQPLVENAIKHGVAGLVEGGCIRLEAHCSEGLLRLRVENEFDPEAPAIRKSGVGLTNIRGRLLTRYDHRARLHTEVRDNHFLAELTLPCESSLHKLELTHA